ncbi:MAG: hydroxylamine oxidation protein HaoB [Candidatus Competibacteraceae bacterium]|nr:hydroxylamine oxidation protein HaoB [Candidatus Competibacteraceae bacterium]
MTRRSMLLLASLLLSSGLATLVWVGWSVLHPLPPPYQYSLIQNGTAADFPALGLSHWSDLPVQTFELRATGAEHPLAVLHTSRDASGQPVLLDWQNQLAEPVLTQTAPLPDLVTLAQAIEQHTPADALILGWWDVSRQLALLTGREVLFGVNLVQPLLLPASWQGQRADIEKLEQAFWQVNSPPLTPPQAGQFEDYIEALLLDEQTGVTKLRALAGDQPAYLVVHLSDILKVAALQPQRFGMGYRDFANSGQIHGLISRVKEWLHSEGYASYTVDASAAQTARVYYLTDAATPTTLLARALSFSTSNPLALQTLQLVYQTGGFWVYKVPEKTG